VAAIANPGVAQVLTKTVRRQAQSHFAIDQDLERNRHRRLGQLTPAMQTVTDDALDQPFMAPPRTRDIIRPGWARSCRSDARATPRSARQHQRCLVAQQQARTTASINERNQFVEAAHRVAQDVDMR
jgi:hypothetical protein